MQDDPKDKASRKAAHEQREGEVVTRLDDLARAEDGPGGPGQCSPAVFRLRQALADLGGGFAVFGRYLSSRADLLPARDCLTLSEIALEAPPTPADAVCGQLQACLGRPVEEAYAFFDPAPFASLPVYQMHRARLHNGRDVMVKVVHPDLAQRLEPDRILLGQLQGALNALGWSDGMVAAALGHFDRMLAEQMDAPGEMAALQALAGECQVPELCRVPAVYPGLCGRGVLTVETFSERLDRVVAGASGFSPDETARRMFARTLCEAWLLQALNGCLFPVTPHLDHLAVLPEGRVGFIGGRFARLSADAQETLRDYLAAVVAHDPERACGYLLKEMTAERGACDAAALQHAFRQAVPFRDGGWGEVGHQDTLSEHLFVHWRLATLAGHRANSGLLDFFRGLFLTAAAAHRLAPGDDALKDAMASFQDRLGRAQLQDTFDVRRWVDAMDTYAAALTGLPQKLDDVLTRASNGDLKLRFSVREAPEHRRERNRSALAISLLLSLVAIVLLAYHLSRSAAGNAWVEKAGAVAFAIIGGLLLWVITRSKG